MQSGACDVARTRSERRQGLNEPPFKRLLSGDDRFEARHWFPPSFCSCRMDSFSPKTGPIQAGVRAQAEARVAGARGEGGARPFACDTCGRQGRQSARPRRTGSRRLPAATF
jgi:hypothetical protein